ncbi:MAG: DUF418 domain-containing protein [Ilumatobacter sp.]
MTDVRTESDLAPSESVDRLPGPDVVRALALIGVAVMNYHGYLIIRGAPRDGDSSLGSFFDPFSGPLATRFAATFVVTAGIGVTLLTRRVVADKAHGLPGAAAAVTEMRWRLVRRGLALYVLGQILDIIWPGTIILYYGAMFVLAAWLFTVSSRWLAALGLASALAGWAISAWKFQQVEAGDSVDWLIRPGQDSIRRVLFELTINGTHPLFPWLAFFCAGIIVGRNLGRPDWRAWCVGLGAVLFAVSFVVSESATTPFQQVFLSRDPFDRGLVYVASALGTSLLAVAVVSWVADRAVAKGGVAAAAIEPLRLAGQMSLTLYIAHILVFNLMVDWLDIVQPDGLTTALTFALAFWVVAIAAGTAWSHRFGRGPAERVYRAIGG